MTVMDRAEYFEDYFHPDMEPVEWPIPNFDWTLTIPPILGTIDPRQDWCVYLVGVSA